MRLDPENIRLALEDDEAEVSDGEATGAGDGASRNEASRFWMLLTSAGVTKKSVGEGMTDEMKQGATQGPEGDVEGSNRILKGRRLGYTSWYGVNSRKPVHAPPSGSGHVRPLSKLRG